MALLQNIVLIVLLGIVSSEARSSMALIRNVHRGGDHYEGPHWSSAENALYWVDITKQMVLRMDGATGNVTTRTIGYGPVSLVISVKDYPKLVLVTSRTEVYLLNWNDTQSDTSSMRLLSVVDLGHPDNRCNDGKADAKGRLWFGTMGKEVNEVVDLDQATFYMMDQYNHIHPEDKVKPVSISNGLTWTADNKFLFYIDTPTRNVDVFDFDLETASIRNRRTLFSFKANNVTGSPDGMTIDSDNNLWVACYNGGKVIKIDSRAGKLLEQHKLPAAKVTSVMWGGRNLSTLYVTTSRRGLNAAELAQQPEAGSLFAIEGTGVRGLPTNQFVFPHADKY